VTEIKNAKLLQKTPRRCPSSTFWLVVRHEKRKMEVLIVACSSEQALPVQALPVFSGEREAEMFVWLEGAIEHDWRVRETSAGELVSILYGPCAGVGRVALDPSPEMVGIGAVSLVSVTWERFLSWILNSPCSISLEAGAHQATIRDLRGPATW
jgi:hypothetical protein